MNNQLYKPTAGSLPRRIVRGVDVFKRSLTYFRMPHNNRLKDVVFFIIDPSVKQAGFADRIKSIVNTYFIAYNNGLQYKLYFQYPFDIKKYLEPNKVEWECDLKDIDKSLLASRLKVYLAEYPVPKLSKGLQYHYYWYMGSDLIRYYYTKENPEQCDEMWHGEFRKRFFELFRFSPHLEKLINSTGLKEKKYVSVHFRFVNLLGNFEGNQRRFPVLPEKGQSELISQCLGQLELIKKENDGIPIYVFSDSVKFLKKCVEKGYKKIDGERIGNVSTSNGTSAEDKTMLDFFTIGRSRKVYSVVFPKMYSGVFSQYAALIGGAEFIRING